MNRFGLRSCRRHVPLALLGLLVPVLIGCGGGSGTAPEPIAVDVVSGKVTYKGEVVTGEIVFVGADKTESSAPIEADGSYQVTAPPKGDVQILVKATASVPRPAISGKGGALKESKGAGSTKPPAKYASLGNGLKFNVTGGTQSFDIDLK